jgi:hypothetical protein
MPIPAWWKPIEVPRGTLERDIARYVPDLSTELVCVCAGGSRSGSIADFYNLLYRACMLARSRACSYSFSLSLSLSLLSLSLSLFLSLFISLSIYLSSLVALARGSIYAFYILLHERLQERDAYALTFKVGFLFSHGNENARKINFFFFSFFFFLSFLCSVMATEKLRTRT